MPHTKHPPKGRLSREEHAARAAARFVHGADMPPVSTLLSSHVARAAIDGSPMDDNPLVERLQEAIAPQTGVAVMRARTRLVLGLPQRTPGDMALGLRVGTMSMQTPRTQRPIQVTLAAEASIPMSTPDLLLIGWHALRRTIACLVLARDEPGAQVDTAVVQDADPRQTAALSRAITLTQVGGAEIAVLPVAFDDNGLPLGGSLQLVRGPDACETLTFTLALVELDAPPPVEIDAVLFVQELFPVYAEAAFGLVGATRG